MTNVALIISAALVVWGIVAGLRGSIVVFRDGNDLALCFASVALPFGAVMLGLAPLAAVIALGLLGVISVRSFADNGGVLRTALAVITKIPLGILFVYLLGELVAPTGKTAAARASARSFGFLGLALLGPLVLALTRDRTGFGLNRVQRMF